MKNPNRNRITVIAPYKPLCVPFDADQGFSKEIMNRRTPRTAAPWERLGLVYLEERAAAPERTKNDILVNHLTQQMIFRIFLTNRSRKPTEWNPAGFVLLKKIFQRIAKGRNTVYSYGAMGSKELYTALRLLLRQTEENESPGNFSEISDQKLKRTLTRILRGIFERARTNIPPDIRIAQQKKTLLKLLTERYADRFPKETVVTVSPKKAIAVLSALNRSTGREGFADRSETEKRGFFSEPVHTGQAAFRTVEDSEYMVMLLPPGDRAKDGYTRQLPPIEYKRNPPREQAEPLSPKRPKVINRRQTQTDAPVITGRLENFSREEINRLTDKIYAQIETRVLRERRRAGM